jgi:hypothetical protein
VYSLQIFGGFDSPHAYNRSSHQVLLVPRAIGAVAGEDRRHKSKRSSGNVR